MSHVLLAVLKPVPYTGVSYIRLADRPVIVTVVVIAEMLMENLCVFLVLL